MSQQNDTLTTCRRCGSPYCLEAYHPGMVTWNCLGCGFMTRTTLLKNTDLVLAFEESLPSLYKDLKYIDEEGFVWYPLYVDKPGVGIVFAEGTDRDNWGWTFVPYTPITKEEKEKFKRKDGTYPTHKTDMGNAKRFAKDEFPLAMEAMY